MIAVTGKAGDLGGLDEGELDMSGEMNSVDLELLPGELWWGGAVADGCLMPFGEAAHRRDLATSAGFVDDDTAGSNQSTPRSRSRRA